MEMWRSLRDRRAATPVRGQRQGHPVDSPGGCPPAAPTPAHRLPRLPHISTAGGLAAAIGATTLIFFQPPPGLPPLRASLAIPFHCRTETGGGAGQNGRGNPVGVPQGGRRGGHRPDRGAARPRPSGGRITPLWGAFGGGGGAARRVGEPPSGVPREAPSIERKTLH